MKKSFKLKTSLKLTPKPNSANLDILKAYLNSVKVKGSGGASIFPFDLQLILSLSATILALYLLFSSFKSFDAVDEFFFSFIDL